MSPTLIFWVGYFFFLFAMVYAKMTARPAWNLGQLDRVENIWYELKWSERELISSLRKTILKHSTNKEICQPRYERISNIYDQLVEAKTQVSVDNSDLHEADALLELMRKRH
jgi:hypothetical protein